MDPRDAPPLWPRDVHPALQGSEFFFMTGEDSLRIASSNTAAGVTLTIVGRFLSLEGEVRPFVQTHVPLTNGTVSTSDWMLGTGWLMNVAVFASVGTPTTSQCFVMLRIVRGLLAATQELATVAQGYCTANNRVAWPGMPISGSASTTGTVRQISGTQPGAGAEVNEVVPASVNWQLLGFYATLSCSGTVANRLPLIVLSDPSNNVFWKAGHDTVAVAGNVRELSCGAGAPAYIAQSTYTILPTPVGMMLPTGAKLKTLTVGIQVGDQWSVPRYTVLETAA